MRISGQLQEGILRYVGGPVHIRENPQRGTVDEPRVAARNLGKRRGVSTCRKAPQQKRFCLRHGHLS